MFSFEQLIAEGEGRAGLVVSLVAVLELAKNQMISILQNEGKKRFTSNKESALETLNERHKYKECDRSNDLCL